MEKRRPRHGTEETPPWKGGDLSMTKRRPRLGPDQSRPWMPPDSSPLIIRSGQGTPQTRLTLALVLHLSTSVTVSCAAPSSCHISHFTPHPSTHISL